MARTARKTGFALATEIAGLIWANSLVARFRGGVLAASGVVMAIAFATWNAHDPSLNAATEVTPTNALGFAGAALADLFMQSLGITAWIGAGLLLLFGLRRVTEPEIELAHRPGRRAAVAALAVLLLAGALAGPAPPADWPLSRGLGGFWGDALLRGLAGLLDFARLPLAPAIACLLLGVAGVLAMAYALRVKPSGFRESAEFLRGALARRPADDFDDYEDDAPEPVVRAPAPPRRRKPAAEAPAPFEPDKEVEADRFEAMDDEDAFQDAEPAPIPVRAPKPPAKKSDREARESQPALDLGEPGGFRLPELAMLAKPKPRAASVDEGSLRQNARMLEGVLAEFGVKGVIDQIRPGPVVTLYELAPAPGVKHSRVVALSDDIARSMSVSACRISVVSGRNAIGIELPNSTRETVYLRDLLASTEFEKQTQNLPLALGETIGGEPYVADLSKMPHLLIAGTTGSGKSVGVNAMILSILYRLRPDQCRFIMIDPKMLELSVYDGIPHLLAPVVTEPKKAIVALKWTVREMEDRYRRMSKIGVRNVAGYNERAREALAKGEHFERTVQTGFDEATGKPLFESEKIRPEPMPYLVVVIDEVADLMLVAGKEIEGAVQRLAQMARAAGIHLIMATQRPSVDVITGTIKANFPTRISFQVTSKIDARTILGEQGAEQLLGQGDMLYMAGGGRVTRLHGPFVSDGEVETVANYLREQGDPDYLDEVTTSFDEDGDGGPNPLSGYGEDSVSSANLYDQAVAVVTRDRKASTSYVQRRLQIGYNRAASLIERMEKEGVVSAANHAGKREVLAPPPPAL